MPQAKKKKASKKPNKELKADGQEAKKQSFFDELDQKILEAIPIKDRKAQLERQQKLCLELQQQLEFQEKSFGEILEIVLDEDMSQKELLELKELQEQVSFYLELEQDLERFLFPTKDLFKAIEKEHTDQESLKTLLQKRILLTGLKDQIRSESLFNHVYQVLKPHGIGKKTLQNMLKAEGIPRLKTKKASDSVGEAKEEEEKDLSFIFPFKVLGFSNTHDIKISHGGQIKSISINQARQGVLGLYVENTEGRNNDQLTDILLNLARKEGSIDDQNTIKTGIDYLEKEEKFLIVSGTKFFTISQKTLKVEILEKPVVNGKLLEGDRYKHWISPQQIKKASLKDTFEKVRKQLKQWEWEDEEMADYMAAFIMLYPFHKFMNYRPWLYLLGGSQSGKTTLIEGFMMPLYSNLVMKMDKSTAHSTAQEIGNTAIIPIFDEFEKFRRLEEILELFKMTSSKGGGVKKSGTPGKEPLRFEIKQMPLFASIYTPTSIKGDFAQDNRTLIFKLSKSKKERQAPTLFTEEECRELRGNIISSVIENWDSLSLTVKSIERQKESIVKSLGNKITSRTVNNFCYALALIHIARGGNDKDIKAMVPEWSYDDTQKDDGDRVLTDILHARINHEGKEHLIVDLLYSAVEEKKEEDKQILRKNGITPAISKGEQVIAFDSKQIKKTLFKQDDYYSKLHIGDVLERLPGAKKNQSTRFGSGDIRRSTQVHFSVIQEVAKGGGVADLTDTTEEVAQETVRPQEEHHSEKPKATSQQEEKTELITQPLKHYNVSVEYITSTEQTVSAFANLLTAKQPIALDIETYSKSKDYGKRGGLDPYLSEIRLVQCYSGGEKIYVFDLQKVSLKDFPQIFWEKQLICHNALFELQHLKRSGMHPRNVDCTLLMAHTLSGKTIKLGLSLKRLCEKALKIDLSKEQQVSDWSVESLSKEQIDYAAVDALVTFKLFEKIFPVLKKHGKDLAYKTKKETQYSLTKMKLTGLYINRDKHQALMDSWKKEQEEAEQNIKEILGDINPNSGAQLNEWLKENIDKRTLSRWKKTKTGKLQTSQDVLKLYKDQIPWFVDHERFKGAGKNFSTYGEGLLKQLNPVTGRLHSDISIAGTVTGRLSSANPNCQNFPKDKSFREIFEAPKGKTLVLADYSQMELRVAALISNDEVMLKAYEDGIDLHRKTAAFVAGVSEKEVTKEQRQQAKAINFGFLFGQKAQGFVNYARDSYGVVMSLNEAENAQRKFFQTYQGLKAWQEKIKKDVVKKLRVQTPLGFIRYFDKDTNRWSLENEALNLPVQGGAAESTLKALKHIEEKLDWEKAQIINCIHDEIIIESNDDYVADASKILEEGMIQGFLDVFPNGCTKDLVEVGTGKNWADAKC